MHNANNDRKDLARYTYTVDEEIFTGLNVYAFNPIEVVAEILLRCLGQKCFLFSIIKERCLYSWKNFRGTLENRKKCKNLAQRIFPHLQYINIKLQQIINVI